MNFELLFNSSRVLRILEIVSGDSCCFRPSSVAFVDVLFFYSLRSPLENVSGSAVTKLTPSPLPGLSQTWHHRHLKLTSLMWTTGSPWRPTCVDPGFHSSQTCASLRWPASFEYAGKSQKWGEDPRPPSGRTSAGENARSARRRRFEREAGRILSIEHETCHIPS